MGSLLRLAEHIRKEINILETSPCKDCSERCYNCHSACGKYQKYSAKRKNILARTRSEDLRAYYCEKYARIGKR